MVHFSLWTAAWWWAHSVMALSVLVGPPLNHSVMWGIWQYTAGMVQPGAWQPRSRARMARRWVGVKNRWARCWASTSWGPSQIWPTRVLSQASRAASWGWIGPILTASDR